MDSKERDQRSKKHKHERGDNYNEDERKNVGNSENDSKEPFQQPDTDINSTQSNQV